MPQDTGSSDNSVKLDTNELDSWLGEYTLKKEQIGLVHYAERLALLIAQLGHDKSWDTLNCYFSEEHNRRRLWTPNRDDECNLFLIDYSPDYRHSYLRLDDEDPYNENLFVWVDGSRVIPNEVDSTGTPLYVLRCGPWLSNNFLLMYLQTLAGHPQNTYDLFMNNDTNIYKRIYSILIWDCKTKKMHIEHPTHDQIWTDPQVRIEHGKWFTYPDKAAYQQDKPDSQITPFSESNE
jgi:hypothetical protein